MLPRKLKQGRWRGTAGLGVCILNYIFRESLTEKAFEQTLEGGEGGLMQIFEGREFQVEGTAKSLGRGMPDLLEEQDGGLEDRGGGGEQCKRRAGK